MTINWTSGGGTNRIVLVKAGSAVDSDPVDGTTYTPNTVFGSAQQIGTGNRVVYTGTGNSVAITGLSANTTYYVAVYEFNGYRRRTELSYNKSGYFQPAYCSCCSCGNCR